jgi:hypothetical protein
MDQSDVNYRTKDHRLIGNPDRTLKLDAEVLLLKSEKTETELKTVLIVGGPSE